MKRLVIAVVASAILAATGLAPLPGHAASARQTMSINILSVKPTTITKKQATVVFRLGVRGLALDAVHMGKGDVAGRGHIQLYVDSIPADAYSRKDLQHHWLASLATTTVSLNLSPAIVGGAGKHRIIAALARNSGVLYRVPTASVTITVK